MKKKNCVLIGAFVLSVGISLIVLNQTGLLIKNRSLENDNFTYSIVIDAGSTGSRLHVYKFGESNTLAKELYEKVCKLYIKNLNSMKILVVTSSCS